MKKTSSAEILAGLAILCLIAACPTLGGLIVLIIVLCS